MSEETEIPQERLDFERWYLKHWQSAGLWSKETTIEDVIEQRDGDGYLRHYMNGCWIGWQARAGNFEGATHD